MIKCVEKQTYTTTKTLKADKHGHYDTDWLIMGKIMVLNAKSAL